MSKETALIGCAMIVAERHRQIDQEGWTAEHDDQWANGEMAMAAACYSAFAQSLAKHCKEGWERELLARDSTPPEYWPWHEKWWKPSPDPVRNLEKAGALIAAEIDRTERAKTRADQ